MFKLKNFYKGQEEFIQMLRMHSTCSPACCHCCYALTRFSVAEALLMLDAYTVDESDLLVNCARLKEVKSDPDKWLEMKIPCLFLRDGVCQCYDARPWVCRSYFVASPVEVCAAGGEASVLDITSRNSEYAEIMRTLAVDQGLPWGAIPQPLAVRWALAYKRDGYEAMMKAVKEDLRNDAE